MKYAREEKSDLAVPAVTWKVQKVTQRSFGNCGHGHFYLLVTFFPPVFILVKVKYTGFILVNFCDQ